MFQRKFVAKIKTHILFSIIPPTPQPHPHPRKSCRLWDNVEKCCRLGQATGGNIKRLTSFACCWITKATNTHSEYVILIGFPLQQWLHERASMLRYTYSALHTTSEHGVSSITTADAHTSAASSRLNWRPRQFKWTRPFRRKMKSGFRSCAITFQT